MFQCEKVFVEHNALYLSLPTGTRERLINDVTSFIWGKRKRDYLTEGVPINLRGDIISAISV